MKQQPKLTLVSHLIEGEKGLIEWTEKLILNRPSPSYYICIFYFKIQLASLYEFTLVGIVTEETGVLLEGYKCYMR